MLPWLVRYRQWLQFTDRLAITWLDALACVTFANIVANFVLQFRKPVTLLNTCDCFAHAKVPSMIMMLRYKLIYELCRYYQLITFCIDNVVLHMEPAIT